MHWPILHVLKIDVDLEPQDGLEGGEGRGEVVGDGHCVGGRCSILGEDAAAYVARVAARVGEGRLRRKVVRAVNGLSSSSCL